MITLINNVNNSKYLADAKILIITFPSLVPCKYTGFPTNILAKTGLKYLCTCFYRYRYSIF